MSNKRNNLKSHFKFNKQERSGIFFLLLIIVLLQLGYIIFLRVQLFKQEPAISVDNAAQTQIDRLKSRAMQKDAIKIYPFNPNFISDYKGYALGMSVDEIDRLLAFRARNKFVNTPREFQLVTMVSDSLLDAMSPYFKFPDWTKGGEQPLISEQGDGIDVQEKDTSIVIGDLNTATVEDLETINGIGEVLSDRIIKFRDRLGGFLVDEQLYDVYGLEADVADRTFKRFKVKTVPTIVKINLNTASVSELVKLVYIRYAVAQAIVAYRQKNGSIASFDELKEIADFPTDKIDRITLYLTL